MNSPISFSAQLRGRQRGASLIMVLLILIVVSVLGAGGAQIAIMSERGARNDRDQQVAWQAAEAALIDAEAEMYGTGTATRRAIFDSKNQVDFVSGCGTSGNSLGLCILNSSGKPAWLVADFTDTSANAMTVPLGQFTGRTFAAGGAGIQPAKVPRYVFEMIPDPIGDKSNPTYLYRVTAMGFGPRPDIQSVVQMVFRI
jgi:type IV pilus assembly protein PilX